MQQAAVIRQISTPPANLTLSEVARRAGINRSTLHRIATGQVEPNLATVRELALVQGLDLEIALVPLSDPDAASAARYLLDAASAGMEITDGIRQWIVRLDRLRPGLADPELLLAVAARAASLLHRRGALFFRGDAGAHRLASAGDASGGQWAISGNAAIALGRSTEVRGPSVLWVDQVASAARMLTDTHRPVTSPLNAHVVVAQANSTIYTDLLSVGQVRYVAPIQMLLDCIGLGGELAVEAESIAREWSQ